MPLGLFFLRWNLEKVEAATTAALLSHEWEGDWGGVEETHIMVSPLEQRPETSSLYLLLICYPMEGPCRSKGLDLQPGQPEESLFFLKTGVAMVWKKLVFSMHL